MNHMITARETHAASDDRLSRIRALLAQAENLGRPSEEVLDDIAVLHALPQITLGVPCAYVEARKATIAIGEMHGPA